MSTILIIILILLLIGALPTWPYSNGWGYYQTDRADRGHFALNGSSVVLEQGPQPPDQFVVLPTVSAWVYRISCIEHFRGLA